MGLHQGPGGLQLFMSKVALCSRNLEGGSSYVIVLVV